MTTYRVLITGSRNWRRATDIHRALDEVRLARDETATLTVVHGAARWREAP